MERGNFISVHDATERLGVSRGTMRYYLGRLGIETHKFDLDKRHYIRNEDFLRIQRLREEARGIFTPKEDAMQPLLSGVESLTHDKPRVRTGSLGHLITA